MTTRCPTCRATVAKADPLARWPFCSERCRMVDLGRWLGGDYRVAGDDAGVPGDEAERDS